MESNEQQQLALIAEMIGTARKEFSDNSFIYLLWGWSVCVASLSEFVLIQMGKEYHAIVWAIFIPLALIGQVVFLVRQKKRERVKSHLDKVMGYVWTAVGSCIALVLLSGNKMQLSAYPMLIMLYGIGTFISGGLMKLKAMVLGGMSCWVIAAATFYVSFEYQLLLLSLSLILAYIIPGHILKNRFRQHV